MRKLFLLAIVIVLFPFFESCTTRSFHTTVLVPADISIPQHIQTVGIVNRSLPEKSRWLVNLLEGFVTGESILADRESSMHTIRSAANTLNANPRFKAVLLEGEDLRGTGTKAFPLPLEWTEVDALCRKYNVDAIISLETYDSDIFIARKTRERTRKRDGKTEKYNEYLAELNIRVNAGWRFYDNAKKRMIDQQVFVDEKSFSATGLTPDEALSKLPYKRRALNDAGIFAGEMLAFRVSPKWLNTERYYFTKAKKESTFKETKNVSRTKQWEDAAVKWLPLTNSPDKKIAGRAAYNMAVASEMDGNLDEAIKWATLAYKNHNLKRAKQYINILNTRKMEQYRLIEQMEGN